jgi:hypothetical protein
MWEDNIKMDLIEIWGGIYWIDLAHVNSSEPSGTMKCWGILEWLSD